MLEQFVIIYPVLSCYILIIEQLFAKYLEESDILKKECVFNIGRFKYRF